jgi:hypothetical protein
MKGFVFVRVRSLDDVVAEEILLATAILGAAAALWALVGWL